MANLTLMVLHQQANINRSLADLALELEEKNAALQVCALAWQERSIGCTQPLVADGQSREK